MCFFVLKRGSNGTFDKGRDKKSWPEHAWFPGPMWSVASEKNSGIWVCLAVKIRGILGDSEVAEHFKQALVLLNAIWR